MKSGTEEILALLKRQRSMRLTQQHFADLADDVVNLGKTGFLEATANISAPRPAKRTVAANSEANPLLDKMMRYRKQSGLSASDFNSALSEKFERRLGSKPPKSVLKSGRKYLDYLKKAVSAADIEDGFAKILEEYA